MHVKTDKIWVRSVPELLVLHQCHFPGFKNVLWLYKILLGGRHRETALFLQLPPNQTIEKLKIKIKIHLRWSFSKFNAY